MPLFIFGSTGDLVKRKIVPAFVSLNIKNLEIIALGRKEFTDKMYQDFVCDDDCFKNFEVKPKYQKIEFGETIVCERCDEFLKKDDVNYFYSALPPKQTDHLLSYVGGIKRGGFSVSLLIEKPFGRNLRHARELDDLARRLGLADDIYVSDHYLFKKEVRNLKPAAFKNARVVSLESVGLEKRANYYDDIGALKDMVQSHFLNIVFKLLDKPKEVFSDLKVRQFVRAQYQGYAEELGRESETETFVRVSLDAADKHFEFITGKSFDKKLGFVEIDGNKNYFSAGNGDYSDLFTDFFAHRKDRFATINQSLLGWEITEKIERAKPALLFYDKGMKTDKVINNELLV